MTMNYINRKVYLNDIYCLKVEIKCNAMMHRTLYQIDTNNYKFYGFIFIKFLSLIC